MVRKRAVGSNQYKTQWDVGSSMPPSPDLMAVADEEATVERWRQQAVVANVGPYCPTWVLQRLAKDPDLNIRLWTVWMDHIPPQTLAMLANDPSVQVRQAVARHRACPPDAMVQLADDPDWVVRRNVVLQRRCPPEALLKIAAGSDDQLRRLALAHSCMPEEYRQLGQIAR